MGSSGVGGISLAVGNSTFAPVTEPLAVKLTGAQDIAGAKNFLTAPTVAGAAMGGGAPTTDASLLTAGTLADARLPAGSNTATVALKAPLASPAFTGAPTVNGAAIGSGGVTFTGSGSGAPVVNVRTNGTATGNGATDDTAAIHAIRDSVGTSGIPIHLPAGTYLVTALALNVAGQRWTLAPGAIILQKAATTTVSAVIITGAGVTFSGGKIDGNKVNQTYAWSGGITSQSANVTISDVEVSQCFASGINLEVGAVGNVVTRNYCHDNGKDTNAADGILLGGATYARVTNNRCEYNGSGGGANEALYDGNGIQAFSTTNGHNLIANNQCSWNARRGIKIQEPGVVVTGNSLAGNSCGIGVTDGPGSILTTEGVISGNIISNSYLQGLQLDNCKFFTITGNQIIGSGSHGVGVNGTANGCSNILFSGNTVARSNRNGLQLASGCLDWTINGNMFLDNGQGAVDRYGLVVDSSGGINRRINITGNTSQNSGAGTTQTHGFVLTNTTDQVNLVGNTAVTGLSVSFSFGGTITNMTKSGNVGPEAAGQATFTMDSGASISGNYSTGFKIGADTGQPVGFWGKTPVARPSATPAAATDLATALTLLNDIKAKLTTIGLTG